MITPAELCDALTIQGRRIKPRRVTDWRGLELLPPLVQGPGRGQGPGRIYYWEDGRVIEQAAALCDVLKVDRHTDTAFIHLWALGHEVPMDKVRHHWIRRLVRLQQSVDRRAERRRRSGGITAVGQSTASYVARQTGFDRDSLIDAVQEMAAMFAGSPGDFDAENLAAAVKELLFQEFRDLGFSPTREREISNSTDESAALTSVAFLQRYSLSTQEHILRVCLDDDFRLARELWVRAFSWAESGFSEFFSKPRPGQTISRRIEFGAAFGRTIIPIIIDLLRSSRREDIVDFVGRLESVTSRDVLSAAGLLQCGPIPTQKLIHLTGLIADLITMLSDLPKDDDEINDGR